MQSLPITLPETPAEPARTPVPFLAALVPVVGAVAMWGLTGSLYALVFAALGPLMLVASLVDRARVRRRARRTTDAAYEAAWAKAEGERDQRHAEERAERRRRHPDAAACLADPPLRAAAGPDAVTPIVVGSGRQPSALVVVGGDGERALAFRRRCAELTDSPVVVALGGGVCVRGPLAVTSAYARALVVQLRIRFGAGRLDVTGPRLDELGLSEFGQARSYRRRGFRLAVVVDGDGRPDADAVVLLAPSDGEIPSGITTVIDVTEPRRATLRTPEGMQELAVEGVSRAQAAVIAAAESTDDEDHALVPSAVSLGDLAQRTGPSSLPAVVGRGGAGDITLDIVDDGPHAIVTGTTGVGKSELLVSWVAAIAAEHGPDRVSFVLADFKGGTAFDPLRTLPHVAAVITDLDDAGARRGVSSLTAELKRREGVLAAAGVRDVRHVSMPRLVIVVDEFAALLQEHPDLGVVFTDIAARGRALGMHLVLGTQRASGVIRDALAANCPLRVSLRVSDAADSRVMIGTTAAAEIPGGPEARGLALVRRPQDDDAVPMRVALTDGDDLRRIGERWAGATPSPSPWLAPLPGSIRLEQLLPGIAPGAVVIGLADVPDKQQQPVELLHVGTDRGLAVIGSPGSGRTTLLRTIARQVPDALWMPRDPEQHADTLDALARWDVPMPSLVLCDDLDAQIGGLPPDYAQRLAQIWEQVLRTANSTTFVLAVARSGGAVTRLLDALPRRMLLRTSSRVEHMAAGGDPTGFDRDRAVGRAVIGDREVQVAWPGAEQPETPEPPHLSWRPRFALTALVTQGPRAVARQLAQAFPECEVVVAPTEPRQAGAETIIVGDAESWQRGWPLWQKVRAEGEVLVRAENPVDLRQLAGVRELPPYARPHAGRVWSVTADGSPRRLTIPCLTDR